MSQPPLVYFSNCSDKWPDPHRCWLIFIPRKWWSVKAWKQLCKVKEIIGDESTS